MASLWRIRAAATLRLVVYAFLAGASIAAGSSASAPVMSIVAADLSFDVSGVTTPEVRTALKTSFSQSIGVDIVGPEQVDCFIGLPEGMPAQPSQASLTSQFTWTVCCVVTVPEEDAAVVSGRLTNMSTQASPAVASYLAEALERGAVTPDLIADTFEFHELRMISLDGLLGPMMPQVAQQEVLVLDALLAGNTSVARRRSGMFMTMAMKLNSSDLQEQTEGFLVQEAGQFEIFVPGKVFDDLQATDLILVTVYLGDVLTRFLDEETVSVNINLYTQDGANIMVSDLTQPMLFNVTIQDGAKGFMCGVWQVLEEEWSTTDVIQAGALNTSVMCATTHLSLFGAVAAGFTDAFRCSQARLLTTFGVRQLWERSWVTEVTSSIFFAIVVVFVVLMFVACVADCRRSESHDWSDEHFLIAQSTAVAAQDPAFRSFTGLGTEEAVTCQTTTCGEVIEVLRAVARDVADECIAAFCTYFEACRQAVGGLYDVVKEAYREEGERRHGFLVLVCIKLARTATERTVHLNACAKNRVHPDDPVAIKELYSCSQDPASSASLPSRPEQSSTTISVSHSEDVATYASSIPMSGTKSEQTLMSLHASHNRRRLKEKQKVHRIPHTLKHLVTQFLFHGPLGSVYVFSISSPSKIRALLLICELASALAVATLFMTVSGKNRARGDPQDCISTQEARAFIGRLVALGLASAVLGGLPIRMLSMLHHRKFVVLKRKGGQEWERQLRAWRWRDAALWILGSIYLGFCLFYNMLFFANMADDHHLWLVSAGIVFASELILFPIAALMIAPLTLLVCIVIVAVATAQSRKIVMQQLVTDAGTAKGKDGDESKDVDGSAGGNPKEEGLDENMDGNTADDALEAGRVSAEAETIVRV